MKPKTLMLMGVAIVCGLVASYMTSRLIAEKNETVKVLMAQSNLAQWTPVRDPAAMFIEKELPKNQVPPTFVPSTALAETKDRPLAKALKMGQVVTWEDLQSRDKAGLEALLPKGTRAFAIESSARMAAGGFVLPGSHIDLILVKRGQLSAESTYVLENVLVRAVDLMPIRPDDRPGMVPSTITIQVTPEEALKLSKVVSNGQLMLTLRPFGDSSSVTEATQLPVPPAPIAEPVVASDVVVPTPMESPETRLFYQTSFDGRRWTRIKYTLDLEGNVVKAPQWMELDGSSQTMAGQAPIE